MTLFFYMSGSTAMGEHKTSSGYTVSDYGQRGTDFQLGKTISL